MKGELVRRIAEELQKEKMSQKQLAERLNLSESAVSRIISGEREIKSDTLANIATALNVTVAYLLGEEETEFNYKGVKGLLSRHMGEMTTEQKKELIDLLFEGK